VVAAPSLQDEPAGDTPIEVLPGIVARQAVLVDYVGDDAGLSAMLQQLTAAGVPVVHFAGQVSDLEDIFMQVTRGVTQ
jgi:ABC-2 type transport system ATP-binding protein